jgi:Tol biopolymer transport system component
MVLVESRGHVIAKAELLRRVWPDTFVEEANLSHQVFTLRKALGEGRRDSKYIETIPRRGYRFLANVTELQDETTDILVEERRRTHIVIEEGAEVDDLPGMTAVPVSTSRPEELIAPPEATPHNALPLKRSRAPRAILAVGLVVAAGTGLFVWQNRSSNRGGADRPISPAWQTRITRLTGNGKVGGTISPDGRFIAYWQNHTEGAGTLWLRQTASNKEIQLIEPGENIFGGLVFSPDLQFIYYVVYDKHDPGGALYRVPILGGPPTRLQGLFSSMFSLSPDGAQVTSYRFSDDLKRRSLVIASLDGSDERTLLTRDLPDRALGGAPAWSPDGKRIAFAAVSEPATRDANGHVGLFVFDLPSQEVKPLAADQFWDVGKMSWTQDGRTLFFVAARARIGNQVYSLAYPEGTVRRLTPDLQSYGNYGMGVTADGTRLVADLYDRASQLWSVEASHPTSEANRLTEGVSDGAAGLASLVTGRIAYIARTGDDFDLWTIREDGSDPRPMTADSFYEGSVRATPDGRYLVFASNRAGGSHLFRVEASGSNLIQLTSGEASDSTPDCSPDGKWIVYVSSSGDKPAIWKISIDGGSPIQLTDYSAIAPSFSPDGRFVSCILPSNLLVKNSTLAVIPADGGPPVSSFDVIPFDWSYVTPRWTPDGRALVYVEKRKSVSNLWKQPLSGNLPEQVTDFKTDQIFNFVYSREGRRIVLARGRVGAHVVLMSNFK